MDIRLCTHNVCFERESKKNLYFSNEIFIFLFLLKSLFIAWASFCNDLSLKTVYGYKTESINIHSHHFKIYAQNGKYL